MNLKSICRATLTLLFHLWCSTQDTSFRPCSRALLHSAAVTCHAAVSGLQPQSSPCLAAPRLSPCTMSPSFCPCSTGTHPSSVSTDPTAHIFNTPTEVTKPLSPNLPRTPLSSQQSRTGPPCYCSRWPLLSSRHLVGIFPSLLFLPGGLCSL